MTSHQVAVAAEAFAACLFSHADCDVSIQYGANQPGYDLVITRQNNSLRVSVKGSQDGGWGLTQGYKRGRTYQEAAEAWRQKQNPTVLFCLVQFKNITLGNAPRCYLAWPNEIATHLGNFRAGHGHTILYESHKHIRGLAEGFETKIPEVWNANQNRIDGIFQGIIGK